MLVSPGSGRAGAGTCAGASQPPPSGAATVSSTDSDLDTDRDIQTGQTGQTASLGVISQGWRQLGAVGSVVRFRSFINRFPLRTLECGISNLLNVNFLPDY